MPHICVLGDGRRVPFSLKRRERDPFYLVCFRSPKGTRLEKSTKEVNQKRAVEAAGPVIRQEYEPKALALWITWDEAVDRLTKALNENNNKARTLKDYLSTIRVVREAYPESRGPQDITSPLAKQFKTRYQAATKSAYTVANRLNKLSVIWNKWFIETLELLTANPWEDVPPPKLEKLTPRLLTLEEIEAFLTWLDRRWYGWQTPRLFFTVKGMVGCRLGELCSLRSTQLQDGRIVFPPDATKGRKERKALLPADIFAELKKVAGPVYLWERYTDARREILTKRKQSKASRVRPFDPIRLERWMQKQIQRYLKENRQAKPFSAHDFRRQAMTAAYQAGVSLDRASTAFGCNPNTMRAFYLSLDETAIADEVLGKIQAKMMEEMQQAMTGTEQSRPKSGRIRICRSPKPTCGSGGNNGDGSVRD